MRSPHIIVSLVLFVFLSLILQTHQRTIGQTHRIGSNVQHVNDVAVTSRKGEEKRALGFGGRKPHGGKGRCSITVNMESQVVRIPSPIGRTLYYFFSFHPAMGNTLADTLAKSALLSLSSSPLVDE
ncbi:hypothetical protein Bca52824_028821 [Brassica carinata]|uniref:Uncharacterized protein n=1 Tax=Brassica carinata TaxID=52824 RepID=A0A8X7VD77_BRACI|nr:hypothetical protein Bca52824_028821 [Brassica carinata]